ncbi:MAG: proton-conducting transporter transmembrane domain-containing protein [Fimbriimonadaceae bacterium]
MPSINLATETALAAMALWSLACLVGLLRGPGAVRVAALLSVVASGLCLASAFWPGGSITIGSPFGLAGVDISFRLDPLSRWFLGLIGLVGLTVSIYTPGYLLHLRGRARPGFVWSGLALLFVSMAGVVTASNSIVFIAFWELMALSSFLLVATEHERQAVRRAAYIYLGATRIGSAFLMGGFLWAHALTGSWDFQAWIIHGPNATGPAVLILIGFLTKAGSWPFHLWLPIAHPVAPSPVSAVMSGVMIKTAIYGIFRLFVLGGIVAPWIGWVLLALGAISAFWGVLFALLQDDLKRVLAYSTVENVGLILLATGVALVAKGSGLTAVADVAVAAALFHSVNHGIFKSLLFLGAGAVDAQAHTREMDRLGGLIHRMPWTAATFLVGSAAICALPLLNGFAGEWLLYRGLLMMGFAGSSGELRLMGLLLIGWLGLVGALALSCFARAFGITFLGEPRSSGARNATEAAPAMIAACLLLAMLCAILGLATPWIWDDMRGLGFIHSPLPAPPPLIPVAIAVVGGCGVIWLGMARIARGSPLRRSATWDCGFGGQIAKGQYTASGFSQPIVRLFGVLYRYEMSITVEGNQRRHFPTGVRAEARHEAYLESKVYGPLLGGVHRLSERFLARLQAGSIHQYLLLMLITLTLLLFIGGVR